MFSCLSHNRGHQVKRKTKKLRESSHSNEEYYDNAMFTGPHSMAHYPSVGYPALGYRQDASFEEGSATNPYYYHRRPYEETGLDESACVWQA